MILVVTKSTAADDELEIDARQITGQAGTESLADDAVLKYGDLTLEARKLLYDTQAGWVKAFEGVNLKDGKGNTMRMDLLDYFPQLGRALAKGDVQFQSQTGLNLWAHLIRYEINQQYMFLEGGVRLQDSPGNTLESSSLEYDIPAKSGTARDVTIHPAHSKGTITAVTALVTPEGYSLEEAVFTTCMIDDPEWSLAADSITVDNDNVVTAKGAKLNMFGVPIFYLPSLSFINSDERRSGFLVPKLIGRSGGEVNVEVPFYLNLAPNYDALLRPRFINGTGVYTQVESRWLFNGVSGNAAVGYIRDEREEEARGNWRLDHHHELPEQFQLAVSGAWISDDDFGGDFLDSKAAAQRHYEQRVAVYREEQEWSYGAHVLHHRTIFDETDEVERPFDSLPGAWVNWKRLGPIYDLAFDTNFDVFQRGDDDPNEGYRMHSTMTARHQTALGSSRLDFTAGIAGSVYELDDASWVVPFASVQLSQPFEGYWSWGEYDLRQVIEPRVLLGVVKSENFDNVPVYDSARTEFNASDIYQVNSFVGGDRFEDSHVLVYGVDTNLWSRQPGTEVMSARIAQRYQFTDSQAQTGSEPLPSAGFSNVVAEATLLPTRQNTIKSRIEWDPDISQLEQVDVQAQHRSTNSDVYTMSYARNISDPNDSDKGQTRLQIYKNLERNWQLASDISYDLEGRQLSQIFGGVRYRSNCRCWSMDLYVEREPLADNDRTSYYFQISLEGLGGFGSDVFDNTSSNIREQL